MLTMRAIMMAQRQAMTYGTCDESDEAIRSHGRLARLALGRAAEKPAPGAPSVRVRMMKDPQEGWRFVVEPE